MKDRVRLNILKQTHVGFKTGVLLDLAKKVWVKYPLKLPARSLPVLDVILTDDKTMKELNKKYRRKNKTTDVLSFSYLEDLQKRKELWKSENMPVGGIFINIDALKRQAEQQGLSYCRELKILFVHGLLHILGFDHQSKEGKNKMRSAEKGILGDNSGLIDRKWVNNNLTQ